MKKTIFAILIVVVIIWFGIATDVFAQTCPQANEKITCTPNYVCGGGGTQCKKTAEIPLCNYPNMSLDCNSCACVCKSGYLNCDNNLKNGCEWKVGVKCGDQYGRPGTQGACGECQVAIQYVELNPPAKQAGQILIEEGILEKNLRVIGNFAAGGYQPDLTWAATTPSLNVGTYYLGTGTTIKDGRIQTSKEVDAPIFRADIYMKSRLAAFGGYAPDNDWVITTPSINIGAGVNSTQIKDGGLVTKAIGITDLLTVNKIQGNELFISGGVNKIHGELFVDTLKLVKIDSRGWLDINLQRGTNQNVPTRLTISRPGSEPRDIFLLEESGNLFVRGNIKNYGNLSVLNTAGNIYNFYVGSDGKVGIGTDKPAAKLDVRGDASVENLVVKNDLLLDGRISITKCPAGMQLYGGGVGCIDLSPRPEKGYPEAQYVCAKNKSHICTIDELYQLYQGIKAAYPGDATRANSECKKYNPKNRWLGQRVDEDKALFGDTDIASCDAWRFDGVAYLPSYTFQFWCCMNFN